MTTRRGRGMPLRPCSLPALVSICDCPIRIELMCRLSTGPRDVGSLARLCGFATSLVSYHMGELHRHGLVDFRHDKRRHIYTLGPGVRFDATEAEIRLRLVARDGCSLTLGMIPEVASAAYGIERSNITSDGPP